MNELPLGVGGGSSTSPIIFPAFTFSPLSVYCVRYLTAMNTAELLLKSATVVSNIPS